MDIKDVKFPRATSGPKPKKKRVVKRNPETQKLGDIVTKE